MDVTAAVLAWMYQIRPSYISMFMLTAIAVWLVQAPLNVAEFHRRMRVEANYVDRQRRYGTSSLEPIFLVREQVSDRPLVTLAVLRRILLLVVVTLLVIVTIGLTELDPANGGGPRYVEQGTRLWQDLRESGGVMPFDRVDLGSSAFDTYRAGGGGLDVLRSLVLPAVFLIALAIRTRPRFPGGERSRAGIAAAVVLSLLAPGGVLAYLWALMLLNYVLLWWMVLANPMRGPGGSPAAYGA